MTDFHTHILPGIDDGSRNAEETAGMLKEEIRQGVQQIVATPHFYANRISVGEFIQKRKQSIKEMRDHLAALEERGALFPVPEIRYGAEVYFFPGIGQAEKLPSLCIEETNVILIEMPFMQWTDEILREVRGVTGTQGLKVVLAHIERYPEFQKNRRVFEQVLELPLALQVNTGSFLKGRAKRKFCLNLLKERENVILGSDTHNLSSRVPNLKEGREVIEKKLGAQRLEQIDRLTEQLLG